jgi:hypothetical protein
MRRLPVREWRAPPPDPSYWAHVSPPSPFPRPGDAAWLSARDGGLDVAGLNVVVRANIIDETARVIEAHLKDRCPERQRELMRLWGTLLATEILRQQTKGGKRTWGPRGTRPGLLSLVENLDKPPGLDSRKASLDAIRIARREAIDALWDFTVDLDAAVLLEIQRKAVRQGAHQSPSGKPLSARELHRRLIAVYRFYGIAEPTHQRTGPRRWRFYLLRLARVHFQLERYQDVRLASLPWLPDSHFARWLGPGKALGAQPPDAGGAM